MRESCLVLGGGITGLACAYELQKQGKQVTLLEASGRLGGWIETERGEFLFEKGPKSVSAAALPFIEELDLGHEVIWAQTPRRYLWWNGRLHKVPTTPLGVMVSPVMKGIRLALLKEPLIGRYDKEDESIGHFLIRRFNKALLDRLVHPFTMALYGSSPAELSIRSTLPHLWQLEQQKGSVIRGMVGRRRQPRFFSFKRGLSRLAERLGERLEAEIVLNCPAEKIRCHRDRVEVEAGGRSFVADHAYAALPPPALERLTRAPKVRVESVGRVDLGWRKGVLKMAGSGYLVPSSEEERIWGASWDSAIFPEQNGRAGETRITVMMAEPTVEGALEAVGRHLGIDEVPDFASAYRIEGAIPQYGYGHAERTQRMERDLPKRLTIVGSSFYGVSVSDCISSAQAGGSSR
ncbi:MAG: protoporphyrinogen oxidase [Parachlamydiales bacterium]